MNKSPVDGISDERLAELIAQWHDYATDPFALDTVVALRELSALRETGMVPVLPKITPQIAEDFGGMTYLLVREPKLESGYDWTQDAVDFACLIASGPT